MFLPHFPSDIHSLHTCYIAGSGQGKGRRDDRGWQLLPGGLCLVKEIKHRYIPINGHNAKMMV